MKAKIFIKNTVSNIPYSIGHYFTHIPFSWRLGGAYTHSHQEIEQYNNLSEDERTSYLIKKLNDVIKYASNSFDFYKKIYSEHGVFGTELKYLDDFNKYPIITKEVIREHTMDFSGAMRINTGGTSGEQFSYFGIVIFYYYFFIVKNIFMAINQKYKLSSFLLMFILGFGTLIQLNFSNPYIGVLFGLTLAIFYTEKNKVKDSS